MRRLGLLGAVGIGVGSMLGAGVFVVWGPAAQNAGSWLLAAIALASVVAITNASSTSFLAARHPVAGGAYTFGRRELSDIWGFVAGIGFVVGKTASVAAMALAIGAYVWPSRAPIAGSLAIIAVWVINAKGVTRTARATTAIATVVLLGLAAVVVFSLTQPAVVDTGSPQTVTAASVASAAALVFFAFAGYARLATLGEEVREPRRTIPLAIGIAITIVVAAYLALGAVLLRRPGVQALSGSDAPLRLAGPDIGAWTAGVGLLAVVSATGAMVALMAGIGRTAMAMAREHDLPVALSAVGAKAVPQRAEAAGAAAAIALVWWGDLGFALAMSSVAVLVYYAVANAAAVRAAGRPDEDRWWVHRGVGGLGFVLCLALAISLDLAPTLMAFACLALAVAIRAVVRRRRA